MVPVTHTDNAVEALKAAGSNVKYTRYETAPTLPSMPDKGGHACYELVVDDPSMYAWLLEQQRK